MAFSMVYIDHRTDYTDTKRIFSRESIVIFNQPGIALCDRFFSFTVLQLWYSLIIRIYNGRDASNFQGQILDAAERSSLVSLLCFSLEFLSLALSICTDV